jgi:hypothetical protein
MLAPGPLSARKVGALSLTGAIPGEIFEEEMRRSTKSQKRR